MAFEITLLFKSWNPLKIALPQLWGYISRSHTKFEFTEAVRGNAPGRRSFGPTLLEAKNLRSLRPRMAARLAAKVLASQYWRPKIRGRQTTSIWVSTDSA